jgi:cytochrome c peroxidase
VIRSDANRNYVRDQTFALAPQVTGRTSMDFGMASYVQGGGAFWDGRARAQFVDPQTGQVVLNAGGALESQAIGPPMSDVEMAHQGRDWAQISQKLASARPLALATNIPADMLSAVSARPTYAQLFQNAFGSTQINASRIAQAIATYERTVIPNDTPWDRFNAGNQNAMTPGQIQGWNFFQGSRCNGCHTAPVFSNQSFRNIGVRPPNAAASRCLPSATSASARVSCTTANSPRSSTWFASMTAPPVRHPCSTTTATPPSPCPFHPTCSPRSSIF